MKQAKKERQDDPVGSRRPYGGRPTLKEAEQLHGRILDAATELFVKHGYDQTSIEAIAANAGIGKLTLYRRFEDKDALFQAVALRMSEKIRLAMIEIGENTQKLSDALTETGRYLLGVVLSPQSVAFHRIVFSEAARLPELCASIYQGSSSDHAHPIHRILLRFAGQGALRVDDVDFLARQFVQAIIGNPLRNALLGAPQMGEQAQEEHVGKTVDLFLRGAATN